MLPSRRATPVGQCRARGWAGFADRVQRLTVEELVKGNHLEILKIRLLLFPRACWTTLEEAGEAGTGLRDPLMDRLGASGVSSALDSAPVVRGGGVYAHGRRYALEVGEQRPHGLVDNERVAGGSSRGSQENRGARELLLVDRGSQKDLNRPE